MELLNSIFQFFTDKTKGLSHKAILILASILIIVIIDNTLSFSYYYNTQKKIEQIDGLNRILSDTTLTNFEKEKLESLRSKLILRMTWKDKTWKLLSEIEFKSEKKSISGENTDKKPEVQRSYFWHFVSSGWIFIIVALFMPIVGLKDKSTSLGAVIGILTVILPMFFGIAWIYAKIFSYIPVIRGNPIYNYVLNALLCFLTLLIFGLFLPKKK